jgi:hypothetical protein
MNRLSDKALGTLYLLSLRRIRLRTECSRLQTQHDELVKKLLQLRNQEVRRFDYWNKTLDHRVSLIEDSRCCIVKMGNIHLEKDCLTKQIHNITIEIEHLYVLSRRIRVGEDPMVVLLTQ